MLKEDKKYLSTQRFHGFHRSPRCKHITTFKLQNLSGWPHATSVLVTPLASGYRQSRVLRDPSVRNLCGEEKPRFPEQESDSPVFHKRVSVLAQSGGDVASVEVEGLTPPARTRTRVGLMILWGRPVGFFSHLCATRLMEKCKLILVH